MTVQVFVPGRPVTKGSWRPIVNKKTGRAIMKPNHPQQYDSWVGTVKTFACQAGMRQIDGPVALALAFYLDRPKKWRRSNGELKPGAPPCPATIPDVDKLTRLIMDALTGIAWRDDGQVATLHAEKRYSDTAPQGGAVNGQGVLITVQGIGR